MQKASLLFALCFTCFIAFFGTLFLPVCRLVAFAPLLALILRRFSLLSLLWCSIAIGILADSTSIHYRFGLSIVAYMIAASVLYPFRRRFFEDKPLPFLVLTYLISCMVGIFFTMASLYKGTIHFVSVLLFMKEIFLAPCIDALIGFVGVFAPLKLYAEFKKKKALSLAEEI